ncbi:hypothetical protein [Hyalangium rubrum]|uniref:Uncharacterized protein n=1 Tax=Hyalangium rubrum TaxID=3103134 RepID=A0ABU5GWM7_9BACT|nr:hypothetical protein [Hyalangium sp. s54d21]MDY7225587.1 hypothetical protein [Hyalangium sp. s54d21]
MSADLTQLLPTLTQGATGRFDGHTDNSLDPWHNLNNEGGQPAVTTLTASQLLLQGAYSYSHESIGSGSGSITLSIALAGSNACVVSLTFTGAFGGGTTFTSSGTYSTTQDGDYTQVTYALNDGWKLVQTPFGSSALWYQGVEFQLSNGQAFCFENMSSDSAKVAARSQRNVSRRQAPRQALQAR